MYKDEKDKDDGLSRLKAKDILKRRMNEIAEEKELKKKLLEKRRREVGAFKEYFD